MSFHTRCESLCCSICSEKLKFHKKYGRSTVNIYKLLNEDKTIQLDKTARKNINSNVYLNKWSEIFEGEKPDHSAPIYICNKRCKAIVNKMMKDNQGNKLISLKQNRTSRNFFTHIAQAQYDKTYGCSICDQFIPNPINDDTPQLFKPIFKEKDCLEKEGVSTNLYTKKVKSATTKQKRICQNLIILQEEYVLIVTKR